MTARRPEPAPQVPTAAACAQAAAWIARLHGTERNAATEKGFRGWLAAKAEHRAAFEMANEIWTGADRWPRPATSTFVHWPRAGFVLTLPRAAFAAVLATLAVASAMFYMHDGGVATNVGEQRTITLDDGTRVTLNTVTRIRVSYDERVRRVSLDKGEAFFEVAKRPHWPFVVVAGNREVTAVGTSFVVRRDTDQDVAITLVEGKVAVSMLPISAAPAVSPHASTAPVIMSPGQRLTFAGRTKPKLDLPTVNQVTAWQRGQVILDHTRLAAAVEEMNRYSLVQLAIDGSAADLEVTGVFRAGDSFGFAAAVAETYHLEMVQQQRKIRLVLPSNASSHGVPAR